MPSAIAAVIDREGRVVAHTGPAPFREQPGDTSVPLPDGGRLVTRPAESRAWYRLARSFVHEMRSPLNALAIYVDLLGTKLAPTQPTERPESTGPRLLEKSEQQVRRLDEMLAAFLDVWAPRFEEGTDLALIVRSVGRFADHEARRASVRLTLELPERVLVSAQAGRIGDALVTSLLALIEESEGGAVRVAVAEENGVARLAVEASPAPARATVERARRAFEAAGARVELREGGVSAAFPKGALAGVDDEPSGTVA